MTFKNIFNAACNLVGDKLKHRQMNELNGPDSCFTLGKKNISQVGIDLIVSFESVELKAYDDGVGVWTIGIGTTVYPNGIKVKNGDICTLEQAKSYFKYDLAHFENTVNKLVTVPLAQNQFDALVSLTYNIGSGAFKNSTLLKKLNLGDYRGAADQFLLWNKAGGKVLQGLVRRRTVERELFIKN